MTAVVTVIVIFIAIHQLGMPFGAKFRCCQGGGDQVMERNDSVGVNASLPRVSECGETFAIDRKVNAKTSGVSGNIDKLVVNLKGPVPIKTFAEVLAENERALNISKRRREKERQERLLAERPFNIRSISWPTIHESMKQKAMRGDVATDDPTSASINEVRMMKSTSNVDQLKFSVNVPTSLDDIKKRLKENRNSSTSGRAYKPKFSKMSTLGPMPAIDARPKVKISPLLNTRIENVGSTPSKVQQKSNTSFGLGKLEKLEFTNGKKVNLTTILYKDDEGNGDEGKGNKTEPFDIVIVDGKITTCSGRDALKLNSSKRPLAAKYPRTPVFINDCDDQLLTTQEGTGIKDKNETGNVTFELPLADEAVLLRTGTENLKLDPSKCPETEKKNCEKDENKGLESTMVVMPSLRYKKRTRIIERGENGIDAGEITPEPSSREKGCSNQMHHDEKFSKKGDAPEGYDVDDSMTPKTELKRTPAITPRDNIEYVGGTRISDASKEVRKYSRESPSSVKEDLETNDVVSTGLVGFIEEKQDSKRIEEASMNGPEEGIAGFRNEDDSDIRVSSPYLLTDFDSCDHFLSDPFDDESFSKHSEAVHGKPTEELAVNDSFTNKDELFKFIIPPEIRAKLDAERDNSHSESSDTHEDHGSLLKAVRAFARNEDNQLLSVKEDLKNAVRGISNEEAPSDNNGSVLKHMRDFEINKDRYVLCGSEKNGTERTERRKYKKEMHSLYNEVSVPSFDISQTESKNACYLGQGENILDTRVCYSLNPVKNPFDSSSRFMKEESLRFVTPAVIQNQFNGRGFVDKKRIRNKTGRGGQMKDPTTRDQFEGCQHSTRNRNEECSFERTFKDARETAYQRLMDQDNYSLKKVKKKKKSKPDPTNFSILTDIPRDWTGNVEEFITEHHSKHGKIFSEAWGVRDDSNQPVLYRCSNIKSKASETKTKRRVKHFIPVPTRSEHSPTNLIKIPHPPPPRDIFEGGVAEKLTVENESGSSIHTNDDESLQVLGVAIDKLNVSERDHSNGQRVPIQGQVYPHPPAKPKKSVDAKMMDVSHKGRRVYFPYIKPEDRLPH